MKLSVIIPVYNEEKYIGEVITRVAAAGCAGCEKEIIVVDDGSSDGTRQILEKTAGNGAGLKVFRHEKNQGKTAAIRTALRQVTGDIVIIQDADLEYSPADYDKLIEPIVSGKAAVVYGSRFLHVRRWLWIWRWLQNTFFGKRDEPRRLSHFLAILLLNYMVKLLYGADITDEATCYKAFRADVLKSVELRTDRFEFCPEITAKVLKKGFTIFEVPVMYHPRSLKEGKKIRWQDGLSAIWTLIRFRFAND